MSDGEKTSSQSKEADRDVQPYVDAADRIERTLDAQLQKIQDVDSRAGFITRLVAILLGVVVSTASILVTLSTNGGGSVLPLPAVTAAAGIIAAVGLLGAMIMGIITYLSSEQAAGLGRSTASLLSEPEYSISMEDHLKTTLAAYDAALHKNQRVIQVNATRLRKTLTFLVVGIVYGTVTAASLLASSPSTRITLLVTTTVLLSPMVYYIHTESYIVEQSQEGDNHE